ncbi:TPA: UDP-N-acetylenolpyruvoylglucosamine reductase [Patescibacteria group bacterium]|nr:MAG: UDP-N-acetylenolpyruvoylglucosamine reductase [Parcubacteria group bacterium GW2011_GWA2_46_39]HBV33276.1 UDP-N-acetylenolpyruvoylglucosamine reductase [Patescibacteria group bacterium]HCU47928.1 UDP-N-acetylenolpyruvoylglucosamine reductase [Patescibacteria group bacterium]
MADILKELEKNLGPKIQANVLLSKYTNFKIGGPAKYMLVADTSAEIVRAGQVAHELNLPLIVLGGGANVLVSDRGYDGLVVIAKNQQLEVKENKIFAGAGVRLGFLVTQAVEAGLTGIEPLVAVPGTVGGAIYGNAGLPQEPKGCIGEWIYSVDALANDKIVKYTKKQCQFSYRNSRFKKTKELILSAVLQLDTGDKVTSQQLIKKYVGARKGQPYNMPSSGCIFTNVEIKSDAQVKEAQEKLKGREKLDQFLECKQLPSSWLIDQAGLKGKKMGKAQVSTDHANYIVNLGGAKADDVVMLMSFIKQQVRDKFGIELHEEVQYIGF